MIRSYLHIAWRHFMKSKMLFTINILCLFIGITFALTIGMYVLRETRVNTTLADVENQYLLKSIYKEKDLGLDIVSISPLVKTMYDQYPNLVKNYFRYNPVSNIVSAGDKHFTENIAICDTTLVSMYGLQLKQGNPYQAFANNNSAVVTETFAKKLYGTVDVVGKAVSITTTVGSARQDYTISAVLQDIPYNTVTNTIGDTYSLFVPIEGNRYFQGPKPEESWDNTGFISFLRLKPGVSARMVTGILNDLIRKNSADFVWKNLKADMFPIRGYYLDDNNGAVRKMLLILSLTSIFILLMVIINFVNINIGTSFGRLKEIGLRKTFGGLKHQLIQQFLAESLLITFIAGLLSMGCYELLRKSFSQLLNAPLPGLWEVDIIVIAGIIAFLLLTGLVAGIYPAFILSRTNPVRAVKGTTVSDTRGVMFKRGLLLVQFSLAVFVFICAINLTKQVQYIFNKDIGYNKDQVLVVSALPKQWDSAGVLRMESIRQGLLKLPFVKNASLTFEVPERVPVGRIVLYTNTGGSRRPLSLPVATADQNFASTFGIRMLAGTFFNESTQGVVVNETAVKELGLTPEQAIGKTIETAATNAPITITGVMQDFVYTSMKDRIGPVGFVHVSTQNTYRYMAVKIATADIGTAIDGVRATWRSYAPEAPFDYTFMDDKFRLLYKAQLQLKNAANIATILNLCIVILGILGVVSFMLQKRVKEIAVRKVLGASPTRIIILFIREYAVIILLANLIAWPLAYIVSEQLLANFAYRITQDGSPYALVMGVISVIAFTLIAAQCFRTAISNPVRSLRTE